MTPFRSLSALTPGRERERTNNPALPRMVEVDRETGEPLLSDRERAQIAAEIIRCGALARGEIVDDTAAATPAERLAQEIIAAGKKARGEI
jgi:hypothetical protein